MTSRSKAEIKNALIRETKIEFNKGMMTAWIYLDYGEGSIQQGFGGYELDHHDAQRKLLDEKFTRKPSKLMGLFVSRVIRVVDAVSWEKLVGKTLRVEADHLKVYRIGHYLKDDWFDPDEDFPSIVEEELKLLEGE